MSNEPDSRRSAGEMSRRRFVRNALHVAWITPVVMTMQAGIAGASSHCLVNGTVCGVKSGNACNNVNPIPCCSGKPCATQGNQCTCQP